MTRVATHRPALGRRRFRHDTLVAVDLFSGFGGLTQVIERAGFDVITAANHNEYKVEVHEANHPGTEHWIADLANPDSSDYHSARDLPAGDLLAAGVSCVNHSPANTKKAYTQGLTLFDLDDPDYDERVTRSERDRATANCVLHYAAAHHPRLILVECTTELQSWGELVPGKRKVGDGSTYRWWLRQFENLGYRCKVLFLNSMFFGVGQSRDRGFWVFWDKRLPTPDLEHRPPSWCARCETVVEAVWTWRTGVPPTGTVRYGKQYEYRCPSCRAVVVPPFTPSLAALDLTNLGTRIGDRAKPLAAATMARAERCRQRFAEFPAVLMPAKSTRGTERHPWQPNGTGLITPSVALAPGLVTGQVMVAHRHNGDGRHITRPMDTVTSTHEKAVLSAVAVDNFQGAPRSIGEPLPTQGGSETLAVLSSGVLPYRQNTVPTVHAEAMPTVTSDQIPGLLTAAGLVKNNGGIEEAKYRAHPLSNPLGTVTAQSAQGLLFSGWYKQNGSTGTETAPHPVTDPLGTLTSRDTTAVLTATATATVTDLVAADWRAALAEVTLDDCYFRMMAAHEIGRGCGFDVDIPGGVHGRKGSFVVWGSARDQVDGYGNAVTPAIGEWIGGRLLPIVHPGETRR